MFKEEKVSWKNGKLVGVGLWSRSCGNNGVVICHPHPLMGGSMHNNVVATIQNEFLSGGYSTLRFNFRGVGQSSGSYDEGRGEKQDILSACEFMKAQGVEIITLVGYSFGAWICCRLIKDNPSIAASVILISPPQKYFDFDWKGLENAVELIVCGDNDMFCDADDLRRTAADIYASLTVLAGTDHFYFGQEVRLAGHLRQYINAKKAKKKLDFN